MLTLLVWEKKENGVISVHGERSKFFGLYVREELYLGYKTKDREKLVWISELSKITPETEYQLNKFIENV